SVSHPPGPQSGSSVAGFGFFSSSSRGSREYLAECGIEQQQRSIQFGLRDRQRGQQPDNLSRRAINQQALSDGCFVNGGCDFTGVVTSELEAPHQAGASNLDNRRVLQCQRAQLPFEVRAHFLDVIDQIAGQRVQADERGTAGQEV